MWAAKVIAGWGQGQLGTEQMDEPRQSGGQRETYMASPLPHTIACACLLLGIARGPSFLCQPPMTRWEALSLLLSLSIMHTHIQRR